MDTFVRNGILALANVVEQETTGWFEGHVGASLLAGAALLKSGYLSDASYESLQLRLHLQLEEYAYLLKPLAVSTLTTNYTPIVDAITLNTQQLSRSGHGVIYGALALKALSDNNLKVSESLVTNIAKLITNCTQDKWDRYFGLDDYRYYQMLDNTLDSTLHRQIDNELIDDENIEALCAVAIERSVAQVYHDADGYFFAGEKIHGITHAHAVFLLYSLGYTELASKAVRPLLIQLELNDLKPEPPSDLIAIQPKKLDLSDPTVWGCGYRNEHQIKLAHSYSELSARLNLPLSKLDNLWGAVSG
ncbi:hypothetical protein [Photobacterium swingsii]|uniref:hypothetical protein n=1 Tax=Photobacterium swingsii TaxID=680026 RepID=UPI00406889DD